MRTALWRTKLDSDFNARYWKCMVEKFSERDNVLRVFLAVAASGTVAGWGIWIDYPVIWKVLSGAAAIASIASPILGYGKKVEAAATHAGMWADLRIRYADLWNRYESNGATDSLERESGRLRNIYAELEKKEPRLRIREDKRLARRCQQEVLRANGLLT